MKGRKAIMDETKRQNLISIAEYEEKVFGYAEKIKFRDSLIDIINNHSIALTDDELRSAQKLLDHIQNEISSH